ncbi:MAG: DNA cytosine methyltransferase [Hyphomonadaceae bacterium]
MPTFFEFFAGGGMVRAGLEQAGWKCLFANDFDHKKAATYRKNWRGGKELFEGDVRNAEAHLPARTPDLIWASFPCQDLSLAGAGAGLRGDRSGTFWPFWKIIKRMHAEGRMPSSIVLENVCGALTSHEGRDFEAIVEAFTEIDFNVGAVVIDAELFVPQSRPRLFFIGVPASKGLAKKFSVLDERSFNWHPPALKRAYSALPEKLQKNWVWWNMPLPAKRNKAIANILEKDTAVAWHTPEETKQILAMMSPLNAKKVEKAKVSKTRMVGTMYRRTRKTSDGEPVQRVEVRFDNVAGCLRTPAGGSSRQQVIVVDGKTVRTRLISARETARLMGLDDSYELPERYNDAYHLTGDGVVVPVVKHLAENLFADLIAAKTPRSRSAPKSAPKKAGRKAA